LEAIFFLGQFADKTPQSAKSFNQATVCKLFPLALFFIKMPGRFSARPPSSFSIFSRAISRLTSDKPSKKGGGKVDQLSLSQPLRLNS
jgi:hypothetical protein